VFPESIAILLKNRSFFEVPYCYVIPVQGLGDKLSYISLFPHLREEGRKICLLYRSGDGLSFLYSGVAELTIDVGNLSLDPWIHGDEIVAEGNLFFTWHVLYGNGLYQEKGANKPGVFDCFSAGHKKAVKASMGLSLDQKFRPLDALEIGGDVNNQRNYILLSPIANSSDSLVGSELNQMIDILRRAEMRIIINIGNRGLADQRYLDIPGVEFFTGSLAEFVTFASGAWMCVNVRSGISELCAAVGVRYADVYLGNLVRHMRFWSLAEDFLKPPIFESNGLQDFAINFEKLLCA